MGWFKKSDKPKEDKGATQGEIAAWTGTLLIYLFASTTLVQAFVIPTGSMEDNLLIGDHLFVDKLTYAPKGTLSSYLLPYTEVKRGDVIVFRYPVDINATYVKRVIGLPGDRIRVLNKQVFLNGKPLAEPYKFHKDPYMQPYRDTFPDQPIYGVEKPALEMLASNVKDGEVVVPPDSYFAMGDNRDNSADSRYWGFVPRENIIGKPWIIYWSYEASTANLSSGNVNPDHLLDIVFNFFSKTRWNRTFQVVKRYQHPAAVK